MGSKNCDFCLQRPKYFDGNRTHPFCSKGCASKAANAGVTCSIPNCYKPPFQDANGKASQYCSLKHRNLAVTACLMCRSAPKNMHHHFCGKRCAGAAEKKATVLLEIPNVHSTFSDVEGQFKSSWRRPGSQPPNVKHIYKIVEPAKSIADYEKYRTSVESRGNFAATGRSAGNEMRRWHGTHRECTLGDGGNTSLCVSPTCRLCTIIRTSFDLAASAKNQNYAVLRFGAGVYTSSTAATSDGYIQNKTPSPLKAILLNKVVVGKCLKSTGSINGLTAPPPGYDSVVAEKNGWGGDELVVFSNDAIRPSYLVVYEG